MPTAKKRPRYRHQYRVLEYRRPKTRWMFLSAAATEKGLNHAAERAKARHAIVWPLCLEIDIDTGS